MTSRSCINRRLFQRITCFYFRFRNAVILGIVVSQYNHPRPQNVKKTLSLLVMRLMWWNTISRFIQYTLWVHPTYIYFVRQCKLLQYILFVNAFEKFVRTPTLCIAKLFRMDWFERVIILLLNADCRSRTWSTPINGLTLSLQKYWTVVKISVISWKSKYIKKSDTSLYVLLIYIYIVMWLYLFINILYSNELRHGNL